MEIPIRRKKQGSLANLNRYQRRPALPERNPGTGPRLTKSEKRNIENEIRRFEDIPHTDIGELIFGIMSFDDMISMSGGITIDRPSAGTSIGEVNDASMGYSEPKVQCANCKKPDCSGHFGLIKFNTMIYNPFYIRQIISILTIVCNGCGRPKINKNMMKEKGILSMPIDKRLSVLEPIAKKVSCKGRCKGNVEFISSNVNDTRQIMYKANGKNNIYPISQVYNVLRSISDETSRLLGFTNSKPKDLIMRGMLVIPPTMRPPVNEGGIIRSDQLTDQYITIITINNKYPDAVDKADVTSALSEAVLKFVIGDNKQNTNSKFKPIKERIQGKQGLVRKDMMGKRGNQCGRTILGPQPNIRFGQISIPRSWESILTKEVTVNNLNIDYLNTLLEEGRIKYIISGSGYNKGSTRYVMEGGEYTLRINDKVARWIQNGDMVVFNRQPTLHRQSMIAYEAVLMDKETIGIFLPHTKGHNADFDGDEGNIWNIQDMEVISEAINLMTPEACLINFAHNKPAYGAIMDSITAAFLMSDPNQESSIGYEEKRLMTEEEIKEIYPDTYKDILKTLKRYDSLNDKLISLQNKFQEEMSKGKDYDNIDKGSIIKVKEKLSRINISKYMITDIVHDITVKPSTFNDAITLLTCTDSLSDIIIPNIGPFSFDDRLNLHKVKKYTGIGLLSATFPPTFYYNYKGVTIVDGILIKGRLRSEHVGDSSNSIVHVIYHDYGRHRSGQWITDITHVCDFYISNIRAQTVSISDCYSTNKDFANAIESEIGRAKSMVRMYYGDTNDKFLQMRQELNIQNVIERVKGIGDVGAIREIFQHNNFGSMVSKLGSGAKGDQVNLAQVGAAVGQQYYRGERIKFNITNGERCLPFFPRNGSNIEARGFCRNSLFEGLNPQEQFFLQYASREGLTDKAIRTSESGYLHRMLIKAMENIKVAYDNTVRGTGSAIVQYTPLGDGFDPTNLVATSDISFGKITAPLDIDRELERINLNHGWIKENI
jgi:DNA-directed RNA polymerase beta' subunit